MPLYLWGLHVSKEVERTKHEAYEKGIENWRALCKLGALPLDSELKRVVSQMYMAAVNEFTGRRFFDVPRLMEVLREYEEYVARL